MARKRTKDDEEVTLVRIKDGKEYRTSDRSEINTLRTQGYRVKDESKARSTTGSGTAASTTSTNK